ncbi:hypothetical protein B0A49_00598 [Cryomyces minteri]|uniref:Uncharacterized protein n=2 Tax=Cryomyces TaxID=329878 RepID=A0A4V5NKQ4_9PEZI|nr:hypothetical protein B0A49_00598 [Cryomyces minteri]
MQTAERDGERWREMERDGERCDNKSRREQRTLKPLYADRPFSALLLSNLTRLDDAAAAAAAAAATGTKETTGKRLVTPAKARRPALQSGLDVFLDRKDVEIWVHDKELRSAFWSVATGADVGVYMKHYLQLDLNWKTFDERTIDFCQGITLHHLPGHTDGLIGMQINLPDSGTFLFISDHCHVIENWRDGIPQGWLARDHPAWFNSTQRLKRLEATTRGRVIPGHDKETFLQLQSEGPEWT